MSKTIRRKNYVPEWVTTDWERIPGTYSYAKFPMEGKELAKALAKYHSCKHGYWKFPKKYTRQIEQVSYRMSAKMELTKYNKNPEHEVQIPRKNLLPWD